MEIDVIASVLREKWKHMCCVRGYRLSSGNWNCSRKGHSHGQSPFLRPTASACLLVGRQVSAAE